MKNTKIHHLHKLEYNKVTEMDAGSRFTRFLNKKNFI